MNSNWDMARWKIASRPSLIAAILDLPHFQKGCYGQKRLFGHLVWPPEVGTSNQKMQGFLKYRIVHDVLIEWPPLYRLSPRCWRLDRDVLANM